MIEAFIRRTSGRMPFFTYTGRYQYTESGRHWELRLLTSGTLRILRSVTADGFLVGGGGAGGSWGGGGGGYVLTQTDMQLNMNQAITATVGEGGQAAQASGEASTLQLGETVLATAAGGKGGKSTTPRNGGDGGSGGGGGSYGSGKAGGVGGSNGSNGAAGAYTSGNSALRGTGGKGIGTAIGTRAFGEADGELFSGGGGGCSASGVAVRAGGAGGGAQGGTNGSGGKSAAANTGGGGGGGKGLGGSGIIILRDHRA